MRVSKINFFGYAHWDENKFSKRHYPLKKGVDQRFLSQSNLAPTKGTKSTCAMYIWRVWENDTRTGFRKILKIISFDPSFFSGKSEGDGNLTVMEAEWRGGGIGLGHHKKLYPKK